MAPLKELPVDKIAQLSRKHVAVIGRFQLRNEGESHTYQGDAKSQLCFDLAYYRTGVKIGHANTAYSANTVCVPGDAPLNNESVKPLQLSQNSPLTKALMEKGGKPAEIGGSLFARLLDALDGLSKFWTPEFDRQLTRAAELAAGGTKHIVDGETVVLSAMMVENALRRPAVNSKLLAYLRSSPETQQNFADELKTALGPQVAGVPDNQVPLLITELARLKAVLIESKPLPFDSKSILPEMYKAYRCHAAVVEQLFSCEPLIALVVSYLFSKVADNMAAEKPQAHKIAKELIEKVYKANKKELAARLSNEQAREGLSQFNAGCRKAAAHADAEGQETLAGVVQAILLELQAHYQSTWIPSRSFRREDLVKRNVALIRMIAVHSIEDIATIIAAGKKTLDHMQRIYLKFEAAYGDDLTVEKLQALGNLGNLNEWFNQFLREHANSSGTALGAAFIEEFNNQLGQLVGKDAAAAVKSKGKAISKKIQAIADAYESQLRGLLQQASTAVPAGGSLGGVVKVDAEDDKADQRQLSHQQQIVRRGNQDLTLPKEQAEKLREQQQVADYTNIDAVIAEVKDSDDSVTFSLTHDLTAGQAPALDELLEQTAHQLARGAADLESAREAIVANVVLAKDDAGKAPARGQIRSLLAGEHLLSTPGELSPMDKEDSSLGAHVLLEMIEKMGTQIDYEKNRASKLANTRVDLTCGVEDLALDRIWPISKGEDGERKLADIVQIWLDASKEVFSVRDYIEDMQSVLNIAEAVSKAGGALTVVNDTVAGHAARIANQGQPLTYVQAEQNTPPPGILVVTRQARPAGWPAFTARYVENVFPQTQIGEGLGVISSLPLTLIAAPKVPDDGCGWWPVIWLDPMDSAPIDPAYLVSACLAVRAFPRQLGDMRYFATWKLGPKNSWDDLGSKVISVPVNALALAKTVILSYGLAQRSKIAHNQKMPADWQARSLTSTRAMLQAILPSPMQFRRQDNNWADVPSNPNAVALAADAAIRIGEHVTAELGSAFALI